LTIESFGHGGEQQAHAFRDKGALEKSCRILIFRRCLAGVNGGDIRSKLGLQEGAFQHVRMRNSYFAPGFHEFLLQHNCISIKEVALCFFSWHVPAAVSMPVQEVMSSL
jgi:hypothetical protein